MKQKYNINSNKKIKVPLSPNIKLYDPDSPKVDSTKYKSILGALIHLSINTRPDITFTCSRLAQFSHEPKQVHCEAALNCMQCSKHTTLQIKYDGAQTLIGYADAGFETCRVTGRSQAATSYTTATRQLYGAHINRAAPLIVPARPNIYLFLASAKRQ